MQRDLCNICLQSVHTWHFRFKQGLLLYSNERADTCFKFECVSGHLDLESVFFVITHPLITCLQYLRRSTKYTSLNVHLRMQVNFPCLQMHLSNVAHITLNMWIWIYTYISLLIGWNNSVFSRGVCNFLLEPTYKPVFQLLFLTRAEIIYLEDCVA